MDAKLNHQITTFLDNLEEHQLLDVDQDVKRYHINPGSNEDGRGGPEDCEEP